MNPGPAPTLLSEWISAPVFWAILASLVIVALIVFTAEMFRDRDDEPAPTPHVVNWCDRNGHAYIFVGQWRCTHCGHQTSEQVYDQELDHATDLGRWEQEMTS